MLIVGRLLLWRVKMNEADDDTYNRFDRALTAIHDMEFHIDRCILIIEKLREIAAGKPRNGEQK